MREHQKSRKLSFPSLPLARCLMREHQKSRKLSFPSLPLARCLMREHQQTRTLSFPSLPLALLSDERASDDETHTMSITSSDRNYLRKKNQKHKSNFHGISTDLDNKLYDFLLYLIFPRHLVAEAARTRFYAIQSLA